MTLEKLLNILCEKGWKPRGENAVPNSYWVEGNSICWNRGGKASIRELVSKESGLWQFVCENGMVRLTEYYGVCNWIFGENIYYDESATEKFYTHRNYEYRLIETSLKNEDELEQFLLENIKVE